MRGIQLQSLTRSFYKVIKTGKMLHRSCQTQHKTSARRDSSGELPSRKDSFPLTGSPKVHLPMGVPCACVLTRTHTHIHNAQPLGCFPPYVPSRFCSEAQAGSICRRGMGGWKLKHSTPHYHHQHSCSTHILSWEPC